MASTPARLPMGTYLKVPGRRAYLRPHGGYGYDRNDLTSGGLHKLYVAGVRIVDELRGVRGTASVEPDGKERRKVAAARHTAHYGRRGEVLLAAHGVEVGKSFGVVTLVARVADQSEAVHAAFEELIQFVFRQGAVHDGDALVAGLVAEPPDLAAELQHHRVVGPAAVLHVYPYVPVCRLFSINYTEQPRPVPGPYLGLLAAYGLLHAEEDE